MAQYEVDFLILKSQSSMLESSFKNSNIAFLRNRGKVFQKGTDLIQVNSLVQDRGFQYNRLFQFDLQRTYQGQGGEIKSPGASESGTQACCHHNGWEPEVRINGRKDAS
jgi:hypothetical protein